MILPRSENIAKLKRERVASTELRFPLAVSFAGMWTSKGRSFNGTPGS